jgi:adenylate cyclase class 2
MDLSIDTIKKPQEFEVKVLNINTEEIKDKLLKKGARLVKNEYQISYIYDYPGDKFLKEYDGLIRIRETKSLINDSIEATLTLKKKTPNPKNEKIREMYEEETKISDIQATRNILEGLGLYQRSIVKKLRESYELSKVLYEFDRLEEHGEAKVYLEVEAQSERELINGLKNINYSLDDKNVTSKGCLNLK